MMTPSSQRRRRWPPVVLAVLLAAGTVSCDGNGPLTVTLRVVDEAGAPVPGAAVRWPGGESRTGADGTAVLRDLGHPVAAVIAAPGFLDEPVVVGWSDRGATVEVGLLGDGGGRRLVIHCAGDVMLGRRYVDPDEEETDLGPGDGLLIPGDGGDSARELVRHLAPLFRAAHLRTVNLETVVGTLGDGDVYPGKRWILQTAPDAVAALESLGVDVAVLANNHQRDYMEPGIASTLVATAGWGLRTVGGGLVQEVAEAPVVVERAGQRIGLAAFTTVDGDFVNGVYPLDGDAAPTPLDPEDAWLWEARLWGWSGGGVQIPEMERRIGSAWEVIEDAEEMLDDAADGESAAAMWASARAVYPELQDWTARRGHGGGAAWDGDRSPELIARLRDEVDLVVVQLHAGYQFSGAPSSGIREAAEEAVAAGADLVIGHHPHVLQGVEFIDGVPVVWSLGNVLFDQDFFVTFPSAFVRTVWEDGELLQLRLIPLTLEGYVPVPAADEAARRLLLDVWEASLVAGTSDRGADLQVRTLLDDPGAPSRSGPALRLEHHGAVVEPGLPTEGVADITVAAGTPAAVDLGGLAWLPLTDAPDADVWVGRSLLGVGGFEDVDTDDVDDDATHWVIDSDHVSLDADRPHGGRWCLRMHRDDTSSADVIARPVARVPLPEHRLWIDHDTGADGEASYSLHLWVRARGEGRRGAVRLRFDHFDDTDPTVPPWTDQVREVEHVIDAAAGNVWREVWLDLPESDLAPGEDGLRPNQVLMTLVMTPAERRDTTLWFDDVELVEWRRAAEAPAAWGRVDWIRLDGDGALSIPVRTLPWSE